MLSFPEGILPKGFLKGSFRKDLPEINRAQMIERVLEFPITVARTWSLKGPTYKHFNISAISFPEMERILNVAWRMWWGSFTASAR